MDLPHLSQPNWHLYCGAPHVEGMKVYDPVSLDYGSWCPDCIAVHYDLTKPEIDGFFQIGIFDLGTALVSGLDGSSEPISTDEALKMAAYLKYRLCTWRPSIMMERVAYDDAARQRVLSALRLANRYNCAIGVL